MFPICESFVGVTATSLVPAWDQIPKEFKEKTTIWNELVHSWLFSGLQGLKMTNKPGVDPKKAWEHLLFVSKDATLPYEQKEVSMAYLLDCWFLKDGLYWHRGYVSDKLY